MKMTTLRSAGARSWRAWAAISLASAGLGFAGTTYAAAPPAGVSISNQATASYKDNSGAQQLTTSNTVVTTVSQVGAYTLTPSTNTKSAAAGATVYMAYVLTNTGNGTDTFSINANEVVGGADFTKIEVYLDNGAGQPASTTPLCSSSTAGTACTSTKTLGTGEVYKFVVAYSVPSTATTATWPSNTATVTVTPSSNATTWFSTYSPATRSGTDTVNLTTGAAFSVGKAIAAPAVASVSGTWPVATSGPRGTATTYTISYGNTGATNGNLYIKDTLPAGLTYTTGQSVISCAAGTALTEAASGDAALCNSQGIEFEYDATSKVIQAMIPNVPPSSSGTLSFQVTVANTASIGTSSTSNTAQYSATGCSGSTIADCSAGTLVSTNAGDFTVTASRSVTLNTVDTTAGTPASAADAVTSTNIVPGSFVKQTHTITNTGNDSDNFNLSVAAGNFPSGTTFSWFAADGTSPLLDTNSDGIIDTGTLAAGASKTLVLQIFVPTSTTVASPANLQATVTATSVNLLSVKDATFANVTNVIGGFVDVTNTASGSVTAGDIGPGPGTGAIFTSTQITAGSAASEIPLFIKNYDSTANTYALSASSNASFPGTMPAGWSVNFSSTACASPTPITSTASVAAGAQLQVFACVTSPVTSPTTIQPVYFKITGNSANSVGGTASDIIYDAVSVVAANAYSFSMTANGSGSVVKGLNVDYSHSVTNTGANTCGAGTNYIKVTATLPAAMTAAGWSTAVYKDVDGDSLVSAADTLITDGKLVTGGLAAGSTVKLLVRVYAPGGANLGDVSNVTVTVSDVDSTGATVQSSPAGCGTQTNTDTSTVVTGSLTVLKKQAKSTGTCAAFPGSFSTALQTAAPADCLYYEVTATNNGASPVSNVSISDAAPAYTTLASTPAATCVATGLTGTAVAAATSGTTVSCGSAANTLAPSGTLTLRFAVQIQP
ncbi:MAG: beta strand repeat-containing protein [Limnohabitans sp.]